MAIHVILHGKGEVIHHIMAVLLQYLWTHEKRLMKKSLVLERAEHAKCKTKFWRPAPVLEPEGEEHIIQRSVDKYNLKYPQFYGDSDCKNFTRVKEVY